MDAWFENDVKMYGTQATEGTLSPTKKFENDVKMYGTQAEGDVLYTVDGFENDVKMYGTQAHIHCMLEKMGLRMMQSCMAFKLTNM